MNMCNVRGGEIRRLLRAKGASRERGDGRDLVMRVEKKKCMQRSVGWGGDMIQERSRR